VNYEKDILFFRGPVPGVEKWGETPKRIERPMGPAVCWPSHIGRDDLRGPKWLQEVQRLCLTADVAVSFSLTTGAEGRWGRLESLCPVLKELIILFGDGLISECPPKELALMFWSNIPDLADFRNTITELQRRARHAQSMGFPIRRHLEGGGTLSRMRASELQFWEVGR
jgi:hypothetical protein